MSGDWVTWALQLLLAVLLARVWLQIDKNTDALTQLRIDIPTHYVTKSEFDKFEGYTRTRFHELANLLHSRALHERVHHESQD